MLCAKAHYHAIQSRNLMCLALNPPLKGNWRLVLRWCFLSLEMAIDIVDWEILRCVLYQKTLFYGKTLSISIVMLSNLVYVNTKRNQLLSFYRGKREEEGCLVAVTTAMFLYFILNNERNWMQFNCSQPMTRCYQHRVKEGWI